MSDWQHHVTPPSSSSSARSRPLAAAAASPSSSSPPVGGEGSSSHSLGKISGGGQASGQGESPGGGRLASIITSGAASLPATSGEPASNEYLPRESGREDVGAGGGESGGGGGGGGGGWRPQSQRSWRSHMQPSSSNGAKKKYTSASHSYPSPGSTANENGSFGATGGSGGLGYTPDRAEISASYSSSPYSTSRASTSPYRPPHYTALRPSVFDHPPNPSTSSTSLQGSPRFLSPSNHRHGSETSPLIPPYVISSPAASAYSQSNVQTQLGGASTSAGMPLMHGDSAVGKAAGAALETIRSHFAREVCVQRELGERAAKLGAALRGVARWTAEDDLVLSRSGEAAHSAKLLSTELAKR